MRTLRALLVDDETIARRSLRRLLAAHPEIRIVGEAAGAAEAAKLAEETRPDVIFLDVQMPRHDGFSLLARLETAPRIVFVTSHDRHAVRGFEVNAFDYLLKPVTPARLKLTIERLHAAAGNGADAGLVVVGDSGRSRTISFDALAAVRAEGNYTRLSLADGSAPELMLRSLADWEARLPSPPFARLDRSLVVNLRHVADFRAESRDRAALVLAGGDEPLAIGRTAAARLRAALREFMLRPAA